MLHSFSNSHFLSNENGEEKTFFRRSLNCPYFSTLAHQIVQDCVDHWNSKINSALEKILPDNRKPFLIQIFTCYICRRLTIDRHHFTWQFRCIQFVGVGPRSGRRFTREVENDGDKHKENRRSNEKIAPLKMQESWIA